MYIRYNVLVKGSYAINQFLKSVNKVMGFMLAFLYIYVIILNSLSKAMKTLGLSLLEDIQGSIQNFCLWN